MAGREVTQVVVFTHQTRWCPKCETRWAIGHNTRAAGPENYRCDDCLTLTTLKTFAICTIVK